MIYYYFGSKEALFIAVIEDTYRRFNQAEQALALDTSQPQQALTELIRFVWRYYQQNPEFIALLNTENLLRGQHIAKITKAQGYSSPVIDLTDSVLKSGAARGVFRPDLSARDAYLMIASMAYFYLGNRYTLSSFLGEDLQAPAALAHWEGFVVDAVQRTVARVSPPVRQRAISHQHATRKKRARPLGLAPRYGLTQALDAMVSGRSGGRNWGIGRRPRWSRRHA